MEIIIIRKKLTGMSIICTSLTVRGQPSPRFHVEAWLPFRNREMDYLHFRHMKVKVVTLFALSCSLRGCNETRQLGEGKSDVFVFPLPFLEPIPKPFIM